MEALASAVERRRAIAGIELDRLFLPLHRLNEITGIGVRFRKHKLVIHRHPG
jgi:hypothetical protein